MTKVKFCIISRKVKPQMQSRLFVFLGQSKVNPTLTSTRFPHARGTIYVSTENAGTTPSPPPSSPLAKIEGIKRSPFNINDLFASVS